MLFVCSLFIIIATELTQIGIKIIIKKYERSV